MALRETILQAGTSTTARGNVTAAAVVVQEHLLVGALTVIGQGFPTVATWLVSRCPTHASTAFSTSAFTSSARTNATRRTLVYTSA